MGYISRIPQACGSKLCPRGMRVRVRLLDVLTATNGLNPSDCEGTVPVAFYVKGDMCRGAAYMLAIM